jgi:SAM-dependent methyltransferase
MSVVTALRSVKRQTVRNVKRVCKLAGYSDVNWLRVRQIERWREFLAQQAPLGDVLEISPGWNQMWRQMPSQSYQAVDYPAFDICRERLDRQFHIVIGDQVLEHVAAPRLAVANMRAMLRPGGYALIAAPFLFRVHARPHDYYRWTEMGLKALCLEGGFADSEITVESWGNKACVRAHLGGPVRDYGFGRDLSNDPEYPIMVWAFARRS